VPLHVGRPNIGNRERFLSRVDEMLDRRYLSNKGPFVREFESKIASFLGVRQCVAVCNGTIALEIAIRALELRGEVVVPSFTFIATAHALQWVGLKPVFCDINPQTHTIGPEQVERAITPQTSGILGVHLWGTPCDVAALEEIAKRRNLALLFDAAHAFGNSYRGRKIGNFGRAEVFSFHSTKFFHSFEGGAVATNDDELARKLRLMKNFGFAGYDDVTCLGTNGKMPEISAAMGLTNLESLAEFTEVNRRNYHQYRHELAGIPGVRIYEYDEREDCNYQFVVLAVDREVAGIDRDLLLKTLHAENVLARRYFYPGCHRMEPYRSSSDYAGLSLPATEALAEKVLVLPTGTALSGADIRGICHIVRLAILRGAALRERLNGVGQPAGI
jgi:dTDP-4-amino-4,6-dideoxygalactose transaminase